MPSGTRFPSVRVGTFSAWSEPSEGGARVPEETGPHTLVTGRAHRGLLLSRSTFRGFVVVAETSRGFFDEAGTTPLVWIYLLTRQGSGFTCRPGTDTQTSDRSRLSAVSRRHGPPTIKHCRQLHDLDIPPMALRRVLERHGFACVPSAIHTRN